MTLVVFDTDGGATRVVERVPQGEARREHTLRDLIYDNPAILPVRDIDPGYGRLFTVARELNIPGVGFIDVLLADEHGRLVVVECKLWRNPQARREVVGQILDYARELSRYGYEDLQRQITIATRRQGNVLYALAREAGGTMEEAQFVDRVSRDLLAGRFLLLIAGDGITEGTRRIGEYLRAQPGLAFEFALIEFAEYRAEDTSGHTRTIIQRPDFALRIAEALSHFTLNEAVFCAGKGGLALKRAWLGPLRRWHAQRCVDHDVDVAALIQRVWQRGRTTIPRPAIDVRRDTSRPPDAAWANAMRASISEVQESRAKHAQQRDAYNRMRRQPS